MSVLHRSRAGKDGRTALRLIRPSNWSLWTVSRPFLAYLLTVEGLAVAVVATTVTMVPVTGRHLLWFVVFTAASILHLEITRGIERLRELHTEGRAFTHLQSIWTLAALLVLPPSLLVGMIVLVYTHMWFRLGRQIVPHRWVFSCSNVIVASAAGAAVLAVVYPHTYPALPHGPTGFMVAAAATLVRWLVNRSLTSFALLLMRPGITWRQAFGPTSDNLIEHAALALGMLAAVLATYEPPYLIALAVVVLVMHALLLWHEFSTAHRDRVTGLHNAEFWRELAEKAVERATARNQTLGLLLVHIDRFSAITYRYGTSAGERVLRAVAETLSSQVRKHDLVGRLPGEDFAVLVPEVTPDELAAVGERIRLAIHAVRVQIDNPNGSSEIGGITVSIGGALCPHHASTLADLMLSADGAVINAQNDLGGHTRLAR